MKNKPPLIQCPKCLGSGQILLSPEHFHLLETVRAMGDTTSGKLSERLGLRGTMANGRLEVLRHAGLVDRKRVNGSLRDWIYFAKK